MQCDVYYVYDVFIACSSDHFYPEVTNTNVLYNG